MLCTPGPGDWDPAWEKWPRCLWRWGYVEAPSTKEGVFACPTKKHTNGVSFGLNKRMSANPSGSGQSGPYWWVWDPSRDDGGHYRLSYTKRPSETYLLADTTGNQEDTTYHYVLQGNVAQWACMRHERAINMAYHDTHVRLLNELELDTSWSGVPTWRNP